MKKVLKENKKIAIIGSIIIGVIIFIILMSSIEKIVNNNNVYHNAKSAYEKIDTAYNKTNDFSHDIYQAWFEGINNTTDVRYGDDDYDYGLKYLVKDMNITYEEAKIGIAYAYYGKNWRNEINISNAEDYEVDELYRKLLNKYDYDQLFSATVYIVTSTYKATEKTNEIELELEEAKTLMKIMSRKHSDYIHYPDLKNYLTNTRSFFAFCANPEGSFEQVVQTFNNYRNQSRQYYYALDYIFE